MTSFTRSSPILASADDVFAWHARPAAFFRLIPPWETVTVANVEGPFADGQRVTLRAAILGPVKADWVAELFEVIPGQQFRDRQISGPFAAWTHTHTFTPTGPTSSTLTDQVDYRVPFGLMGRLAGSGIVASKLDAMFRYRHAVTASDLARHTLFSAPPLTVAITGSTGLIGSALCHFLATGGHTVRRLVRRPDTPPRLDGTQTVVWNPEEPLAPELLAGVDAVVHLAGDGIADGRWTEAKKARIRSSRVGPTRRVAEACAAAGVRVFVSGSAIGIYGHRGDEELSETASPGTGFLADVAQEWEAASEPARATGCRVVQLRTGVVLTPGGGALAKQLPAFQAGSGAVVGPGTQWISWITLGDMIGAIHHILHTGTLTGPVNAVAPNPIPNREFGRTLAQVLNRPYLLTAPAAALRVMFGELADAALLASTRVKPDQLTATGFTFDHRDLPNALSFVLRGGTAG